MSVPEDVGCKNSNCVRSPECNRFKIQKENRAREVKTFGGTPEKGCGKFLPIKE
jgi:hypothetical protein